MNVVQVTQSYHPRPGGVTEHVDHITRELRRRGHTVTIVTTDFGGPTESRHDVARLGRNVLVPINGAWVNMTLGWHLRGQLSEVFRTLRPDIIHTHCPLAPTLPLLTLMTAPAGARVVGTFHAAAASNRGYRWFRPMLAHWVSRLDTRIAVSDAALALVSAYFPGDYRVIPNGVDCYRFSPRHQPIERFMDDAFNILFVGRMDTRKGLKYLFRAVALASTRTSRRLRLIVVGDDGLRRYLLPRLPKRVEVVFTGVVDRETLPRYFVTGNVFCSPAVGQESFGIVLLEAMASGVPVVGTAIPGYLTILRHNRNALVVPPRSPRAICEAILRLADDEPLRWRLRTGALDFVEHYRWERVVDHLEAVYRQLPSPEVADEVFAAESGAQAQKV